MFHENLIFIDRTLKYLHVLKTCHKTQELLCALSGIIGNSDFSNWCP